MISRTSSSAQTTSRRFRGSFQVMGPTPDNNTNPDFEQLRPVEKAQIQQTGLETSGPRSTPKRRSRWQSGIASGEDWWVWELAGLAMSAASLVCIFVLLQRYDGKEQPNWDHLSLNTAISFLGVVAKAGVLVAASRGIGQLKWIWFLNSERSLADLQMYDAASRSISGCILLLCQFKARYDLLYVQPLCLK